MNKKEFLARLRRGLSGLPKADIDERLTFYGEMIDDRMEDGLTEEDAVRGIGLVDELVSQIIAEIPLGKLVREKIAPKRKRKAWEVVFLVLGSPVWLPLLAALLGVILSVYAVLWSVIAALWAAFVSAAVCAPAGVAAGVHFAVSGNELAGLAVAGAGIACAGLAVFAFFGCGAATKGLARLTGKLAVRTKNRLIGKEGAR